MWPSVEAVVFGVFYNRIENSQMFTYYVSKEYRKTYKDLEGLGLLSDAISIAYIKYQDYFALEPRSDHQIRQHLLILAQQTLTPLKAIKALLFLHAWMQATPKVGATEVVLEFLKSVLGQGNTICEQLRKARAVSERRVSKSAVLNSDWS